MRGQNRACSVVREAGGGGVRQVLKRKGRGARGRSACVVTSFILQGEDKGLAPLLTRALALMASVVLAGHRAIWRTRRKGFLRFAKAPSGGV